MKNVWLVILAFFFLTSTSNAQDVCMGYISEVRRDEARGSVIVMTNYYVNGLFAQHGESRYKSDTELKKIKKLIKQDIAHHCYNTLIRLGPDFQKREQLIEDNKKNINLEKELQNLVGKKIEVTHE